MSQRIDRSNQNGQNNQNENNGGASYQDGTSSRDQNNHSPLGNRHEPKNEQEHESPIVALEPEEPGLKQGSAFLGGGSRQVKQADGTIVN